MKHCLLIGLIFLSGILSLYAQAPQSPIHDLEGKTIHQSKIYAAFEQYNDNNTADDLYAVFGKQNNSSFDTSGTIRQTGSNYPSGAHVSAAAGDFNGDGYDDVITVVVDASNKPYLTLALTDTGSAAIKSASTVNLEINQVVSTSTELQGRIYVAAGRFGNNDRDDFVVGMIDSANHNILLKWGTLTNGTISMTASATLPVSATGGSGDVVLYQEKNSFHIAVGDFDHSGDDEVAVAYLMPAANNPNYLNAFSIALYDVSGNTATFKGNLTISTSTDAIRCSLTSGNFSAYQKDDLAYAISYQGNTSVGVVKVDMTQGPTGVLTVTGTPQPIVGFQGQSYVPNLAAGDLDGDGTDEIVLADGSEVKVFKMNNPAMTYSNVWVGQTAAADGVIYYPNSGLAVADVDRDGKDEIFLMSSDYTSSTESFKWQMLRVSTNLYPWTQPASTTLFQWNNLSNGGFPNPIQYAPRRYALVVGDFDGKEFTVGTGTMYYKPNIVQPLVILNTPPVHFDILDSTQYDVTGCYNANSCDFNSVYNTSSNTQINVTTTVNQDWGVSAKLSAGGNFGIVDVGGYMSAKYGEKYSHMSGSSTTVNISTQVTATDDDYIYALVSNFYVWEYPIYRKNQYIGNILSVTPVTVGNQWFPSKSWSAFTYVPNHEVGCILSYKDYPVLANNPDLEEKIKASYTGNSFLLNGSNNTFDWSLNYTDVTTNSASTEKDINVEMGAEVGAYGVKLELSGSYSQSAISTYTSTVTTNLLMQAHMGGGLNAAIGEVNYTVTPYTYWAKNGALVLDYAATPELPVNNGGTPTWWSANYTEQDPAFIMPWRYDPEKGYTIQDPRKRRQTKSITFYPDSASTGDTVTIRAIIHNFGLLPSSDSIKVRFYIGDPYYQNVITDIHGVTDFYLPLIDVRDRQILEIQWKVPANIYKYPKIYASIDPDNTLTEIHRNNNIGWNLFNVGNGSNFDPDTIVSSTPLVPSANTTVQVYPNPFTDDLIIKYELAQSQQVEVTLQDVNGRQVAVVFSGVENAGEAVHHIDGKLLPAGIYFVRLVSGNAVQTKRLVKW